MNIKISDRCKIVSAGMLSVYCALFAASAFADETANVQLAGHLPAIIAQSKLIGHDGSTAPVLFDIALPLRNQGQLDSLVDNITNESSPSYHQYLLPGEAAARFGPTTADYNAVVAFAKVSGFTVVGSDPTRQIVTVTATTATFEHALGVVENVYARPDGTTFRSPDREPIIPKNLAGIIAGFVGLDDAAVPHTYLKRVANVRPRNQGTGVGGGLAPSDIATTYEIPAGSNGAGQTLAVFELDNYKPTDITTYESHYGISPVPLQNVIVDNASSNPGASTAEVVLDIELQIAMAQKATKVLVYMSPDTYVGAIDNYKKIQVQDLAPTVSTSWGLDEATETRAGASTEQAIFKLMVAQGQSLIAASGDDGSDDNGSTRLTTKSVDDPASQIYVTGTGATTLTVQNPGSNENYAQETVWNNNAADPLDGASGGGSSIFWTIPSWQLAAAKQSAATSNASTKLRNVPDITVDGDPYTGYSVYVTDPTYGAGWYIYGGTSCGAPLWAAFEALVNQARVLDHKSVLGFIAPDLYEFAPGGIHSADYGVDFHDVTTGGNGQYPAVKGYDCATGLGSMFGTDLLIDLSTKIR